MAFLGIGAHEVTQEIKSHIGFEVTIKDEATDKQINELKQLWVKAPYTASVKYISREDALIEWERQTGENLVDVIGVNPLSAEFEVNVKPQYANTDSLNVIEAKLLKSPAIESIKIHEDLVTSINNNIRTLILLMLVIAGALLLISIALINNTVRLAVYSKRFLIHTMTLVGATAGFIRRPFVLANLKVGLLASLIAIIILSFALAYWKNLDADFSNYIAYWEIAAVFGGIIAIGALICSLAGLAAANRFIGLDYDELFTK